MYLMLTNRVAFSNSPPEPWIIGTMGYAVDNIDITMRTAQEINEYLSVNEVTACKGVEEFNNLQRDKPNEFVVRTGLFVLILGIEDGEWKVVTPEKVVIERTVIDRRHKIVE